MKTTLAEADRGDQTEAKVEATNVEAEETKLKRRGTKAKEIKLKRRTKVEEIKLKRIAMVKVEAQNYEWNENLLSKFRRGLTEPIHTHPSTPCTL